MESITFVFIMELYAHLPTVGPTKSGSTAEHFVLTDRGPRANIWLYKKKNREKKHPIVFTTHIQALGSQVFPYSVIVQEQWLFEVCAAVENWKKKNILGGK